MAAMEAVARVVAVTMGAGEGGGGEGGCGSDGGGGEGGCDDGGGGEGGCTRIFCAMYTETTLDDIKT